MSPADLLRYLVGHIGAFDHHIGRLGHALFLLLAALWAAWGMLQGAPAPLRPRQRFLNVTLVGAALMYVAVPVGADAVGANAWGINFRYLIFTELAFITWCASRWPPSRGVWLTLGCACGLFGLGLCQFWQTFEAHARPVVAWFESLPPGQRMWVQAELRHFGDAWAPVTSHLDAYYMAADGRYQRSIFDWGHVPIRPTDDACGPPLHDAARPCEMVLQDTAEPLDPHLRLVHRLNEWHLFDYSAH